jgi:lysyl-tRNA synthetase class 2
MQYLEVETPCRLPAPIPEAHIDPVPSGRWVLHSSPEIFMKRLLAQGYPRIFQICRCFRDRERGQRHLPEFTLLEWYRAGATYRDLMTDCERLFQHVASALNTGDRIRYQGTIVDLTSPWEQLSVSEAFERFSTISLEKALSENCFDEVIAFEIEPRLGSHKPVFLHDYPSAHAALARRKPGNSGTAERFELYIAGMEFCNGFTELTDPAEQRNRFQEEIRVREAMGKPSYPIPEKFLKDLAAMPDAAGNALGLDRMVMLFADAPAIDQVVAFTPENM